MSLLLLTSSFFKQSASSSSHQYKPHTLSPLEKPKLTSKFYPTSSPYLFTALPLIMPLDHFSLRIPAEKWDATKTFYVESLKSINYKIHATYMDGAVIGMGEEYPDFWFAKVDGSVNAGDGTHFAFKATDRKQVQEFHAMGVENGGTCNGPAGPRPMYGPTYYGGFLLDPCGNNVEVVTHSPQ